ncbi:MAG: aldo/keto reductase [Thaumarchaeota archaeon]|nr:aldo/keto reductase [Nitrososphaerota archaeon]MCL5318401.1 aldo/keto reductase [Nitrososphaerota archaeon]
MEYKELGRTGVQVPVLGQGTYGYGFSFGRSFSNGVAALRRGIDLGMTLIDTAESYGAGRSEEIVGEAIKGQRDRVFLATKVSPENLSYERLLRSAEKSLQRLGTKFLDLYQIHSPNPWVPIQDTMGAMEHLVSEGKIRYVGVSNFSVKETREAQQALSETKLASNQVEYSLVERSIEQGLLQYCQREKITVIAYTPIARGYIMQGELGQRPREIGGRYGKSPMQVALNWLISKKGVIAIPKAVRIEHVEENVGAVGWHLDEEIELPV